MFANLFSIVTQIAAVCHRICHQPALPSSPPPTGGVPHRDDDITLHHTPAAPLRTPHCGCDPWSNTAQDRLAAGARTAGHTGRQGC